MRWPFSTAVSFETKLSADEVRQRLRDYLLPAGSEGLFANRSSLYELPFACKIGGRFCTISKRVRNRETHARVLVLDLDSLRMSQELCGVWRPGWDYLISIPVFVGLAGCAFFAVRGPLIAIAMLLVMVLNLWLPYHRRLTEEPQLESFVQQILQASVNRVGSLERFDVEDSQRPGRRLVRVGYQFGAGMYNVYRAFLNRALARQFLFATTNGTMIRADIDARVGGEFTFVDRRDGVDVLHKGIYTDLCEPILIAFDFCVPQYSDATATVTIKLTATRPGCRAMLICDGVLPEYAEQTREGWERILAKAASVIDATQRDAA